MRSILGINVFSIAALLALQFASLIAASDTSQTEKQAEPYPYGTVTIRSDSLVVPGSEIVVSIVFADTTTPVAGFNLLIQYDRGALVLDSALLGAMTAGDWEYFKSTSGPLANTDSSGSAGFIRLVALADQQDEPKKTPAPGSLIGPGELVRLHFYVSERREYQGKTTYLSFLWAKCDDNTFSDQSGLKLYASRDVYCSSGRRLVPGADKFSGAPSKCFSTRKNAPQRRIDFHSVAIAIK
jgi:hypothetical protein